MRIGVVGINHKLADLKIRDSLAKTCQKRFRPGFCLHDDHAFILLSTCNRTEIYFCSDDLATTHSYLIAIMRSELQEEFDQKLYSFFGADCFHHLCRVTGGLDSAIVAETEIQGQVKLAYEHTLQNLLLPHDLHYLFQKSLKVGKSLRSQFPLQRGLPSLESAVLQYFNENFLDPEHAKVLFIGASDINFKLISYFKAKRFSNLTLCNRTDKKALHASRTYGVQFIPWHHLQDQDSGHSWKNYDAVILGTKANDPILKKEHLQDCLNTPLIIDLGVPLNADPLLADIPGVKLVNIDQLNFSLKERSEKLKNIIDQAEAFVETLALKHVHLFAKKQKTISDRHLVCVQSPKSEQLTPLF